MSFFSFFHSYLPSPIIFSWGPLTFHWYGLLVAVAVVAGYTLARRNFRQHGGGIGELDRFLGWAILAGLAGARLLDVFLFEWWYFRDHLTSALYLWDGGLSWHGALVGGLVVLCWQYRRSLAGLKSVLDLLAPALALGQAVGRWGNYFNQELFGLPTSLPWGIPIAESFRPLPYATSIYFHPVFLYESLALLLLAWLLWRLRRRNRAPGSVFAVYLAASGLLRLMLEFLRIDEQLVIGGIRSGMWLAAVAVIIGASLWLTIRRRAQTAVEGVISRS
ncbi:MAG: prolipoprotein diacylglyceryl transferase [Candidatus Kerfeldbacteria bacterium]|nr:prolipoprotein diacylglyceryl transferase [Candidatus Kerfeldbacteria bacterium]